MNPFFFLEDWLEVSWLLEVGKLEAQPRGNWRQEIREVCITAAVTEIGDNSKRRDSRRMLEIGLTRLANEMIVENEGEKGIKYEF